MADNYVRWKASQDAPLIIHIEPFFEIYGAFNFTLKRWDLYLRGRGGPEGSEYDAWYKYHMFIRLFKGDYAHTGCNPSKIIEVLHLRPESYPGTVSFTTIANKWFRLNNGGNFVDFSSQDPDAYKSSDKYYLVMYCQQNERSGIGGDGFAYTRCTITRTDNAIWQGYLTSSASGGKNPGGSAVYSSWDPDKYSLYAEDYVGTISSLNSYDRSYVFTTVSFPLNPEIINYNPGTIKITAASRNAAYTSITVKVTYTKNSSNPSPTFWSVESADNIADKYKSKIKIGVQDTLEDHKYKVIQHASVSISGNTVTAQYTFTGLTSSQDYNCYAFVLEDLGNGDFGKLSDGPILSAGKTEYAKGEMAVTATRDSVDGTTIAVKGTYTKGVETGKESATAYWGCEQADEANSSNKSKVLVAICDSSGNIIETANVANKGSYTFTGLSATTKYIAKSFAVEDLGGTKTEVEPAQVEVSAWGEKGTITIKQCSRDPEGTSLIVQAEYSGSEPFYGNSSKKQKISKSRKGQLFYYLRPMGETSGYLQRERVANDTVLTFDGIEKELDYDFYAYATYAPANTMESQVVVKASQSSEGEEDHTGTIPVGVSGDITGTTITLAPEFNDDGESDNIEWTAKLGKVIESGVATKNGDKFETEPARFQLLANATTYTIVFSGLYSGAVVQPDSGEGGEGEAAPASAASAIDLLNRDIYYDCMTYGVTVLQSELSKNGFIGTAYQIVGAHGESNHALTECEPKEYAAFCRRRDGSSISSDNIGSVTFNNTTVESARIVGSSAGSVNFTGQTVEVRGLQPSTGYRLYVYLLNCYDFAGKYDAVGYIDFTTEPVAIAGIFQARVTGTSITVTPNIIRWNNSSSITWTMTLTDENGVSADVGVDATVTPSSSESIYVKNLDMGTKYFIDFSAIDDGDNEIEVTPIEVVTYGLEVTVGEPHTRYVTDCILKYTEGERLASTPQDSTRGSAVRWFITDDEGYIVIDPTYANCRRSNPYYFETAPRTLIPGQRYYIEAYIEGVLLDGIPDAYATDWFVLKTPAIELDGTTKASGTTITFTPTWEDSDSRGNVLTVVASLYQYGIFITEKQSTYKNVGILFTKLERGTDYTVAFAAYDNEGNTTADYIQYASGQNGLIDELTYKLNFTNYILSTRSVRVLVSSNRTLPLDTGLEFYIEQDGTILSDWEDGMLAPYKEIIFYYLIHNKNVTIGARYNSSQLVDENNKFDTDEYLHLKTPELTVEMDRYSAAPHALKTVWKAYSNGNLVYMDPISTYPIWFKFEKIEIVPVVRGDVGKSYGLFSYFHNGVTINEGARYFDGLSAGRQYKITIYITDGYNEASAIGYATTLVCALRIYSTRDNKWHKALPYIVHNSYWYPAPAYVYHNKSLRNSNLNQILFTNDDWDNGRFMETNPTGSYTPDDDLFMHPLLGDIRNYPDYYPDDPDNPTADFKPDIIVPDEDPEIGTIIGSSLDATIQRNNNKVIGRVVYTIGNINGVQPSEYYGTKISGEHNPSNLNKILMELKINGVVQETMYVNSLENNEFNYVIPENITERLTLSLTCYVEEVYSDYSIDDIMITSNTPKLTINASSTPVNPDEPEQPTGELSFEILSADRSANNMSIDIKAKYTGPSGYIFFAGGDPSDTSKIGKIEYHIKHANAIVAEPVITWEVYYTLPDVASAIDSNNTVHTFTKALNPTLPYEVFAQVFYIENSSDTVVKRLQDRVFINVTQPIIQDGHYTENYFARGLFLFGAGCEGNELIMREPVKAAAVYVHDHDDDENNVGKTDGVAIYTTPTMDCDVLSAIGGFWMISDPSKFPPNIYPNSAMLNVYERNVSYGQVGRARKLTEYEVTDGNQDLYEYHLVSSEKIIEDGAVIEEIGGFKQIYRPGNNTTTLTLGEYGPLIKSERHYICEAWAIEEFYLGHAGYKYYLSKAMTVAYWEELVNHGTGLAYKSKNQVNMEKGLTGFSPIIEASIVGGTISGDNSTKDVIVTAKYGENKSIIYAEDAELDQFVENGGNLTPAHPNFNKLNIEIYRTYKHGSDYHESADVFSVPNPVAKMTNEGTHTFTNLYPHLDYTIEVRGDTIEYENYFRHVIVGWTQYTTIRLKPPALPSYDTTDYHHGLVSVATSVENKNGANVIKCHGKYEFPTQYVGDLTPAVRYCGANSIDYNEYIIPINTVACELYRDRDLVEVKLAVPNDTDIYFDEIINMSHIYTVRVTAVEQFDQKILATSKPAQAITFEEDTAEIVIASITRSALGELTAIVRVNGINAVDVCSYSNYNNNINLTAEEINYAVKEKSTGNIVYEGTSRYSRSISIHAGMTTTKQYILECSAYFRIIDGVGPDSISSFKHHVVTQDIPAYEG